MAQISWKSWLQKIFVPSGYLPQTQKEQRLGANAPISEQEALVIAAKACQQYDIFWDAETAKAFFGTSEKRPVWSISTGIPNTPWAALEPDSSAVVLVDARTGEFLGQYTPRGHLTPPAHLQLRKESNERLAEQQRQKQKVS